jgi:hypothetical protein
MYILGFPCFLVKFLIFSNGCWREGWWNSYLFFHTKIKTRPNEAKLLGENIDGVGVGLHTARTTATINKKALSLVHEFIISPQIKMIQ